MRPHFNGVCMHRYILKDSSLAYMQVGDPSIVLIQCQSVNCNVFAGQILGMKPVLATPALLDT